MPILDLSLRQLHFLQELNYARVFAQLGEAGIHLKFRDGNMVVLGSLL